MAVLSKDGVDYLKDPRTLKIIATADEIGAPYVVRRGRFSVPDNGTIAPEEIRDKPYAIRRKEEIEGRPHLQHLDLVIDRTVIVDE